MQTYSVDAGLASISASSWNVHSGEGNYTLFSKLTLSTYFSIAGFPASIDFPLALTSKIRSGDLSSQRFAPADLNFYIGKKFNSLEPRIGFTIPLFYSTKGEWIGSKNIKLRMGAGYRAVDNYKKSTRFSGEMMLSMCLNNSSGKLKTPSSNLYASIKGVQTLNKKINLGAELLTSGKYSVWKSWKDSYDHDNVRELGAGIMPEIFADFKFTKKFYASIKAGGGPGYNKSSAKKPLAESAGRWGWSSNLSISANRYF
jgi:hypothetical protein